MKKKEIKIGGRYRIHRSFCNCITCVSLNKAKYVIVLQWNEGYDSFTVVTDDGSVTGYISLNRFIEEVKQYQWEDL